MIRLENVGKSYDGETFVVEDFHLEVTAGELFVLLGESGCGKTTTMKMINRLIDPTKGTIEVDGENVLQRNPVELRRHIGYVFQGIGLFPHMTVGQNVAVVPRLLGWQSERIAERVEELLDMIKLSPDEYAQRLPRELSGGQRQRVGLARALAGDANIMLMDEPFGALDPINRDVLQGEFRRIHDDLGLTTVMVTHDMTEALLLADRIGVMAQGKLVQVATPGDLFRKPANDYVEHLMATPRQHADVIERLADTDDADDGADNGGAANSSDTGERRQEGANGS